MRLILLVLLALVCRSGSHCSLPPILWFPYPYKHSLLEVKEGTLRNSIIGNFLLALTPICPAFPLL